MKIYHKRNFIEGIFLLGLGTINLIMDFIRHDFSVKDIVLCIVLLLLGGSLLARSLSQKASYQDKIEAMDERNKLVKLKAESRAFTISQAISFVLIVGCMIAYAMTKSRDFIGIIVGLGLAWGISILTDIFTSIYYESKN